MTYHYRPGPGSVAQASSSALWGLCILCAHPQAAPDPATPPPSTSLLPGGLEICSRVTGSQRWLNYTTPPLPLFGPPPPVGLEHLGGGCPPSPRIPVGSGAQDHHRLPWMESGEHFSLLAQPLLSPASGKSLCIPSGWQGTALPSSRLVIGSPCSEFFTSWFLGPQESAYLAVGLSLCLLNLRKAYLAPA